MTDRAVPLSAWMRGRRGLVGASLVAAAFVGAVAAPLLTYGTTLALFGPAHVASELRYVEGRFGRLLTGAFGVGLVGMLAAVTLVRAGRVSDLLPGTPGLIAEVAIVASLAAAVALGAWGGRAAVAGLVVGGAVGGGVLLDPAATILVLACLHNWTPVGFLLAATDGAERRLANTLTLALFVAAPLLIATGGPWAIASGLGLGAPDLAWLTTGPLRASYSAYLPEAARGASWAQHAFSALVFAQCLHYVTVIGVMPRLPGAPGVPGGAATRWPAAPPRLLSAIPDRAFLGGLVVVGTLMFVAFALDFKEARAWYGVPAALHAWIEVPVLLVGLFGRRVNAG